jgi:hypothetical protein
MIYLMKLSRFRLAVVGTADQIAAVRRDEARFGKTGNGKCIVALFRKPSVLRMTEVECPLAAKHAMDGWNPGQPYPVVKLDAELQDWFQANGREWDGGEAEKMGLKGLPKPTKQPASLTTLADRLARRRLR